MNIEALFKQLNWNLDGLSQVKDNASKELVGYYNINNLSLRKELYTNLFLQEKNLKQIINMVKISYYTNNLSAKTYSKDYIIFGIEDHSLILWPDDIIYNKAKLGF